MGKDLSHLSDDELMQIATNNIPKPSKVADLSDEELYAIAGQDFAKELEDSGKVSRMDALGTGIQQGVGLGFTPAVAGLGAGVGSALGELERGDLPNEGLADKIKRVSKSFGSAFDEGRKGRSAIEEQAMIDRPGYTIAGNLGGAIATLPFTAVNTAKGAIGLGGLMGTGKAVSEADNFTDAGKKILIGAGEGLAGYGLVRGAEKALPYVSSAIKKGLENAKVIKNSGLENVIVKQSEEAAKLALLNKQGVENAGKLLDVVPTKGMLSTDLTTKGLESSLSQSPSIAGALVRKELEPVKQKMVDVVQEFTKDKTNKTVIQVGESIKEGLASSVGQRSAPIKDAYKSIEAAAVNIPVKEKSQKAIVNNLKSFAEDYLIGNDQKLVVQVADQLGKAKTVDQLRQIRSSVLSTMRNGVPSEQKALGLVVEKLNRAIDSNTRRAAAQLAKESGQKGAAKKAIEEGGIDFIKTLKGANKGYREMMTELKSIAEKSGAGKIYGPESFVESLNKMEPNVIVDKLFNTNKPTLLNEMKRTFPEQFEQMRQLKLKEVFESALDAKNNILPNKFIKSVENIEPEVRALLFGKEFKNISSENALEALKKLAGSIPDKIGPSGTPQGMQFLDQFSPMLQGKEALRYLSYKSRSLPSAPKPPFLKESVKKLMNPSQVIQLKSLGTGGAIQGLDKVASEGPIERRFKRISGQNR